MSVLIWIFSLKTKKKGSYDTTIKIWSITNGDGTCLKTLTGHTSYVLALLVLPNGLFLSTSLSIKVWNVTSGVCLKTLSTAGSSVRALALLSNGFLASGSTDNMIRLWELNTYTNIKVGSNLFFFYKRSFFYKIRYIQSY